MARVSNYLIFPGHTEAAFKFYQAAFKTEFIGEITRFGKIPPQNGQAPLSETDAQLILHIALPTLGDHVLMGADSAPSMGLSITQGNAVYINLQPDSRTHTDALFAALSKGGVVETSLQEMFWGDYYASFKDQFGVHWMLNCDSKT